MGVGDILYSVQHVQSGLPPPEKWGGLALAKTVGIKGYTTETMLEDSKKMVGFESWMGGDMPNIRLSDHLDAYTIREFAYNQGDDNPLYTDPDYAKNTRYGCLIAPQTMAGNIQYPVNLGSLDWGPYPLTGFPLGAIGCIMM